MAMSASGRSMRRARLAILLGVVVPVVVGCGSTDPERLTSPSFTALPTSAPLVSAVPSTATTPSLAPKATTPPRRVTSSATGRPGRMWSVVVTFYGAADNDPPGSTEIAHPNALHSSAGGTGTYANPVSLASDRRAIPVGTRVYYPPLAKYFVMEDDCAGCIEDWGSNRTPHIDLWAGNHSGSDFIACENALTPSGRVSVELNPPPGRRVDTSPLYGGGGCRA
jgi:3D (Asp-Asp-Asp) domain-containing protein